ncbi:MAG: hypothetical protein CVU00_10450 [Bacteroidetes bacterium HGW-Bacteroidetes-17]|jgi:putative ABC transport system permease protein|nr:MAG: hypothetical protein CVU00_10450 [Bacteroidetes bacterium HGW-Bacteroidetes-17]
MIIHYFKIIFRNIIRNKLYTLINLIGFSMGTAASLLLLLYVQHELNFDQFHHYKNQIYRVTSIGQKSGNIEARTPFKLAPGLKSNFPEIEKACRIREMEYTVRRGEHFIKEKNFIQVDTTFFDLFSFKIIYGNAINPIAENNSVVITKSTADKYFPNENPIGKILEITYREKVYPQQITAVIEDFPVTSHIQADFILPIYTTIWSYENINRQLASPSFESWGSNEFLTYILLSQSHDPKQLIEKFPQFITTNISFNYPLGKTFMYAYNLQPLREVHLFSERFISDVENRGSLTQIYLFGGIAILILLIAIINYIILSTAKSLSRSKEIGLRKVIGATRAKIMKQVLSESIFLSLLSIPFAILIADLFLPRLNELFGKSIELAIFSNPIIMVVLLLISLFSGVISGSYLSFYLSSFKPVDVFRSQVNLGLKGSFFQKALIMVQLIIFIGLIICAGVIYNQVRFMKESKVLGFNKENLISVVVENKTISDKYLSLKAELLTNPDVLYVSSAFSDPPSFNTTFVVSGSAIHPGSGRKYWYSSSGGSLPENTKDLLIYESNSVDYDYIETLGIEIIEGRSFNSKSRTDRRAVIVNEQFIKEFNVANPLTEKFRFTDEDLMIVGIVKNYHSKSLTEKVLPVIMYMSDRSGPRYMRQIVIKLSGENTAETLSFIERKWKEINPNTPFEYSFTDVYIEQMYKTEMNLAKLIGFFAIIAIFIASLGLFGLSLFIAQKKTREIVIRKTMGASVLNIIIRLLRQFFAITIVANIIAIPLTYYYMEKWLQNFEYQSIMDYRIFIGAGLSSLILCLLTVSFHSAKAAIINPVEALKYE